MTREDLARLKAAENTFEQAFLPMMSVKATIEQLIQDLKAKPGVSARELARRTDALVCLSGILAHLECLEHVDFSEARAAMHHS